MILAKEQLKKIYVGKTKDVYEYDDAQVVLYTKDETTGWWKEAEDGKKYFVEDPGGNEVGPAVEGMGAKNLNASDYYFKLFASQGLANHYVQGDLDNNLMLVKKGEVIGKGLECIVRFFAFGSLLRRFPDAYLEGQAVCNFFETTLKDDEANDPVVSKEELVALGALTAEQYDEVQKLSFQAADVIREDLAEIGLTLVDIKFEMGIVDGEIMLIDEVSAGVMRVARGNVASENILNEEELADILVDRATQQRVLQAMLNFNTGECCF
ncbi:MAG: phosphoribosylaminoimidazolesuccinocarboxamide synthase [Turicibacter sp.]|nr:phosphoribosylaminoimidazolesuccinocarboxamide synthase [Turicibacter sp.]